MSTEEKILMLKDPGWNVPILITNAVPPLLLRGLLLHDLILHGDPILLLSQGGILNTPVREGLVQKSLPALLTTIAPLCLPRNGSSVKEL